MINSIFDSHLLIVETDILKPFYYRIFLIL